MHIISFLCFRWGNTPRDDAEKNGNQKILSFINTYDQSHVNSGPTHRRDRESIDVRRSNFDFFAKNTSSLLKKPEENLFLLSSLELDLFETLQPDTNGRVKVDILLGALESAGISRSDSRLSLCLGEYIGENAPATLDKKDFFSLLHKPGSNLIKRVLRRDLVIPKFSEFCNDIASFMKEAKKDKSGACSTYIPQFLTTNPDLFGVSICTVDGQRFDCGDYNHVFTVQSIAKVVLVLFHRLFL